MNRNNGSARRNTIFSLNQTIRYEINRFFFNNKQSFSGGKFINFFTLRLLLADEYNIRFNLSPLKLEWELCNIVLERDKNPMQTCLNTACDNITFVSVQHSSCERKDQCRTNTHSHTLTRIHRPIHIYMHTKRTILSLFTSGLKANGTVERCRACETPSEAI